MDDIILPDYHKLKLLNNMMNALCKPLGLLNVETFNYIRIDSDGSCIDLNNNSACLKMNSNNKSLYLEQALLFNPFHTEVGLFLWPSFNQKIKDHLHKKFAHLNGITLIQKHKTSCEIYHLSFDYAMQKNCSTPTITHEMLQIFVIYFKDKASKILKMAEKCQILIPNFHKRLSEFYMSEVASQDINIIIEKFIRCLNINRYYLGENQIYLTRQEILCLKWATKGKTAEEIALILNKSKRTCETHLSNVRSKLNCHRQLMLGFTIAKYLPEMFFNGL